MALGHPTGDWAGADALSHEHCYGRLAVLVSPWPEIYGTDRERRHGLDDAMVEYNRLLAAYPRLGYEVCTLPRASVRVRANLVLDRLQVLRGGQGRC